jgi:peptidoglycan/xylan/chitin deacetylase (PgdA/CDA1 family)
LKLRITTAGANDGVIWIDSAMVPGVGRPTHVITHDDASVTWMANALPVLAANKLRATFGVYTSVIGTNPLLFLSSAQVAEIAAAGHQISSHNVNNYPLDNGVIVDANKQTAAGLHR